MSNTKVNLFDCIDDVEDTSGESYDEACDAWSLGVILVCNVSIYFEIFISFYEFMMFRFSLS